MSVTEDRSIGICKHIADGTAKPFSLYGSAATGVESAKCRECADEGPAACFDWKEITPEEATRYGLPTTLPEAEGYYDADLNPVN